MIFYATMREIKTTKKISNILSSCQAFLHFLMKSHEVVLEGRQNLENEPLKLTSADSLGSINMLLTELAPNTILINEFEENLVEKTQYKLVSV